MSPCLNMALALTEEEAEARASDTKETKAEIAALLAEGISWTGDIRIFKLLLLLLYVILL
jgi:hypothetical protein